MRVLRGLAGPLSHMAARGFGEEPLSLCRAWGMDAIARRGGYLAEGGVEGARVGRVQRGVLR